MNFLISNDDGVHAPGLLALYEALSTIGEVYVVAPETEQSGCASALHISQPLYVQKLASGFVAVNGSPADCVYLALHELYRDISFDCVITGINAGANLGQDVMYSGTFGAALTAQLFGIPAIASSLVGGSIKGDGQDQLDGYTIAADEIAKLISETDILEKIKQLPYHVLNVNVPNVQMGAIKGRKMTRLGHNRLARPVHQVVDPRGRDAYWLSLRKCQQSPQDSACQEPRALVQNGSTTSQLDTDNQAVTSGYISLSPVRLHHVAASTLASLSDLAL